jgi:hypothetical protein
MTGEKGLVRAALLNARPVCERINWARNFSRSRLPSGELSVAEKTQIPINATAMENSAGYSYGKMALS